MLTKWANPNLSESLNKSYMNGASRNVADNAYERMIREKAEELAHPKAVSIGAVYVTLDRLEEKGLVSSWLSEPTPERGGRSKRCYRLEPAGRRALEEAAVTAKRIWDMHSTPPSLGQELGTRRRGEVNEISHHRSSPRNVVGWFLPPACRVKRFWATLRAVRERRAIHGFSALTVTPRVIASQILQEYTDALIYLLTICAICYSFVAGSLDSIRGDSVGGDFPDSGAVRDSDDFGPAGFAGSKCAYADTVATAAKGDHDRYRAGDRRRRHDTTAADRGVSFARSDAAPLVAIAGDSVRVAFRDSAASFVFRRCRRHSRCGRAG